MATTAVGTVGRATRALLVALVVGMLAFGAMFVRTLSAGGQEVVGAAQPASAGSLEWRLSEYIFTNPASFGLRSATAPATYDASTTWAFTDGTGTYDPATGETTLDFTGEMIFENTAAGNYGMKFADPTFTVAAGGAGTLTADFTLRSFGGAPWGTPVTDVTVATFTVGSTTVTPGHVELTVTPDFVTRTDAGATNPDQKQFPQSLIDAVGASFANHFRQSGNPLSANDLLKPPAPITVAFDFVEPVVWTPAVGVSKTTGVAYAGETLTVTGTGFDPEANVGTSPPLSGEPTGVYVVFGRFTDPWQPSAAAPSGNREVLASTWVLPAASRAIVDPSSTNPAFATLGEDGSFAVDLAVAPGGTTGGAYGVGVYAAGGAVNAAHEFLTPITFAAAPDPDPDPDPDPEPEPDPNPVLGGGLDWGFKQSFRQYVQTVASGTITTADGATTNPDGTFHFPITGATGDEYAGDDIDAEFAGSVHFVGHEGALDLEISDLEVQTDGATGVLLGDIETSEVSDTGLTAAVTYDDVEIAALDLSGVTPVVVDTSLIWQSIPATLAAGGAPAFSGFYTAGTPLDPATVTLDFTETPDGDPPSGPPVAGLSASSVPQGGRLTVTADGFTPGEQAEVWVHSDPIFVGSTTADGDGVVTYTFTVPTTLPPGEHRVEVRGVTSGRSVFSAPFTVTAAATNAIANRELAFTGPNGGSTDLALMGGAMVLLGAAALVVAARQRSKLGADPFGASS